MKLKDVIIFPNDAHELVRAQHFLFCLDRPSNVTYVRVDGETKLPIIMTQLSWTEKLMFRIAFRAKMERMTVFG